MKNRKTKLSQAKESKPVDYGVVDGYKDHGLFALAVFCVIIAIICSNSIVAFCVDVDNVRSILGASITQFVWSIEDIIRWGHIPWTLCLIWFLIKMTVPKTAFVIFVVTLIFFLLLVTALVISGMGVVIIPFISRPP